MSSDVIRRLFSAVDSSDWHDLTNVFHPNVVYERPGYPQFRGIEQLLQFYRYERVLSQGQHQIEQVVVEASKAACWGRFSGIRKDGTPVDELFADVYMFEGRMIVWRRSHFFRPAV